MKSFYALYDQIKNSVLKRVVVEELPTDYFFAGPNSISNYNLQVRYGANDRKIHKLSAFSRLGYGAVDERRKIIIFSSLKAGSTTLKRFLFDELKVLGPDAAVTENPHFTKLPLIINHVGRDNAGLHRKVLYWNHFKHYPKYLIIREPYERLVSFFTEKFIRNQGARDFHYLKSDAVANLIPLLKRNQEPLNLNQVSFEYFVRRLFEAFQNGEKLPDEHLSRQITADFKRVALDQVHLVPLPQLNAFLEYLRNRFKLTRPEEPQLHLNKSQTTGKKSAKSLPAYSLSLSDFATTKVLPSVASFHAPHLEKMVRQMYTDDYEAWAKAQEGRQF